MRMRVAGLMTGVWNSAKNIAGNTARAVTLGTALVGAAIYGGSKADAAEIVVPNFGYFTQGALKDVGLVNPNNFTVREAVPDDKLHKFGFSYNDGFSEVVCGDATNNQSNIQRVNGKYVDMPTGWVPTGVIDIHDINDNGIGIYNTTTSAFTLDTTDEWFIAGDFFGITAGTAYGIFGKYVGSIELNGVLDDVSQLPAWPAVGVSSVVLPSVNLVPYEVPEPSTLTLIGLASLALSRWRRHR